jgi:hypothetical protein
MDVNSFILEQLLTILINIKFPVLVQVTILRGDRDCRNKAVRRGLIHDSMRTAGTGTVSF